jgi:hypothetical protein
MIAKVFNVILTYDKVSSRTLVLSSNRDKIILPYFIIEQPSKIRLEIRYLIKSLFKDPKINYVELIQISHLDIQNDLLIDYVESEPSVNYDPDTDLCIYAGIVLTEKNLSDLYWLPVSALNLKEENNSVDFLIDFTIKNLML